MVATVAIVWPCPLSVEEYAAAGRAVKAPRPDCPDCGRVMGFWSGYERWVRRSGVHRVWVRRAKCRPCRVTHALLPSFSLLGRLDVVEVIGSALDRALAGAGLRPVARTLGVPHGTARGWRRRFRARAAVLAAGFGALAVELGASAPWPVRADPADAEADALGALGMAWVELGRRLERRGLDPPGRWRLAALVTGGALLASTMSPPWAGAGGRRWMPPVPCPTQKEAPWPHPPHPCPPVHPTRPIGVSRLPCSGSG